MTLPVALTCGEPAGIGPELAARAWKELGGGLPFFLIGDPGHLPADTRIAVIEDPSETEKAAELGLPVLPHGFAGRAIPGRPDPTHAQSVIDVIARGVGLVQSGAASAICTGPIHKGALQDGADFPHSGHTEYLAALAGVERVVMMMVCDTLRVVPVTIHIPLARVPQELSAERLKDTIRITHDGLIRDFGIAEPRVAVAGLNPHAGEGGRMGLEETELITPVLDHLRGKGLCLSGPHSADTLFQAQARARYDAAICMYHDQALIPIKTLDFERSVNVTLGLPFVRTSPDHGTALDIAGRGAANPSSTIEALKLAARMGAGRRA